VDEQKSENNLEGSSFLGFDNRFLAKCHQKKVKSTILGVNQIMFIFAGFKHLARPSKQSHSKCLRLSFWKPGRHSKFHLSTITSKCASRHNGVQFFISHLARWLRTRRFSKHTFRPSGATNHWKNIVNRVFSTFSRTCIFFPLNISLIFFLLFYLSILSEV